MKHKLKIAILWLLKLAGAFRLCRYLTRRNLMIVGWHGVSRTDEHMYFPGLYVTKMEFRKRLAFLTRAYRVISLDEGCRQRERGFYSANQVVLTFDDGNFDFYAEAVPILQEFSVPATNYIVTSFVETQQPVWNMLVRYILKKSGSPTESEESEALRTLNAADNEADKQAYAERLASRYGVDLDAIKEQRLMHTMHIDELKELSRRGWDFQIHTHEHKNVVDNASELREQIALCKSKLEDWLGKPIEHFCYPSGRWNREAWQVLDSNGIRSATTIRTGPNLTNTNKYCLRRVLNGEINSQIEFEFAMSNVKWVLEGLVKRRFPADPPEQAVKRRLEITR